MSILLCQTQKFINGAYDSCEAYKKDIVRETYENNEIYNNGRHYCNGSDTPLSLQLILIVFLIICAIIANL